MHVQGMKSYARTRYIDMFVLFFLFLCLSYCYAFSRVIRVKVIRENLPSSNVSYDFDLEPPTSSFKKPNFCNDCVCGIGRQQQGTTRIINGNITNILDYPWIVSLNIKGNLFCAGSVITRKHILTAAHCVQGYDIKTITLILMDSDRPFIGKNAIIRYIKSATIHENFNINSINNDIAIIEVDEPIPLNSIVRPVCLPDETIDYTGELATVIGWGRIGEDKPVSDELRKVNLPILSKEECDQTGYAKSLISENMFCVGYIEGGQGSCNGDSGGPLHVKGIYGQLEIIGIVSWGYGCARPNFPTLYTKVTNYIAWIRDHIDEECICPPLHYKLK